MTINAAVEEKLNELLDADGGISRRKVSISDIFFSFISSLCMHVNSYWSSRLFDKNNGVHIGNSCCFLAGCP